MSQPLRTCLQCRRLRFDPWVEKISWRRKWQPTLIFLPGESHGQRSLAGYSPWGCKESDMAEQAPHKAGPLLRWGGQIIWKEYGVMTGTAKGIDEILHNPFRRTREKVSSETWYLHGVLNKQKKRSCGLRMSFPRQRELQGQRAGGERGRSEV